VNNHQPPIIRHFGGVMENNYLLLMQQNNTQLAEQYFDGDTLASSVFLDKYAARDTQGELLEHSPDEMLRDRIAPEFASRLWTRLRKDLTEKKLEKLSEKGKEKLYYLSMLSVGDLSKYIFENYFDHFKKIIPQGRVLAGLGIKESYRSLSNCLRLPSPSDSYSGIMYVDTMLISAAKRGCGYGLGISNLRPGGNPVANAAGRTTGAVSFMQRYSNSTGEVAQKGRRGACLIDIHINHPEVVEFIQAKSDDSSITEANISIKVTDRFMQKVENKEKFLHIFPINTSIAEKDEAALIDKSYNKHTTHGDYCIKSTDANEILDMAAANACRWGCPGLQFIDTVVGYDPSSAYPQYQIDGTNACGEQPMSVYETCRLLALNLSSFIVNKFTDNASVDLISLYDAAYFQLIIGDILIDMEIEYIDRIISKIESDDEPMEEKAIELTLWKNVKDITQRARRVGCGITGLGDAMAYVNVPYGSVESMALTDCMMMEKMRAELDASIDLAIISGTFDGYSYTQEFPNGKGYNAFYNMLLAKFPEQVERMKLYGRRNTNWSTIAPCGSVSILAQSTSGCEPLFSPYYVRKVKVSEYDAPESLKHTMIDHNGITWREELVMHRGLVEFAKTKNISITLDNIQEVAKQSPYSGSLAHNISPSKRLAIQSILQEYTTSAISSTLNLPKGTTPDVVKDIYMESWRHGLKGQTVYIDGSKGNVLTDLSNAKDDKKHDNAMRPSSMPCNIHHLTVNHKKYYAVVGIINDKPYEIFTGLNEPSAEDPNKITICKNASQGRVVKVGSGKYNLETECSDGKISYPLAGKHDDPQVEAITRLVSILLRKNIEVELIVEQLNKTDAHIFEFAKVIGRVLKKYIKDRELSNEGAMDGCDTPSVCQIVMQEGCKMCKACGRGKCG